MKQKAIMTSVISLALAVANADGVSLHVDHVQQRYPWNGLVDIDYTITCDSDTPLGLDDNLEVLFADETVSPAATNRALTFLQAPLPTTAGKHRITWNANADGVTNRTDSAAFMMKIVHYAPVYMVIDVSGGAATNTYPVDFFNGEPKGGFNKNEYKGDKIVLRRIHPGSYLAGSPSSPAESGRTADYEVQHRVAISRPFYIGLFEITQKQYKNVTGKEPSSLAGDYRPVERVSYEMIRGVTSSANWPAVTNVSESSFIGKLLQKCKAKDPTTGEYTMAVAGFDLPTEFQWEYACRAGTTGAHNATNELALLGRYSGNLNDDHGNPEGHTTVGSYLPNQWGLYDMHGNVNEWCRDWFLDHVETLAQYVDPVGPPSGTKRVMRGGSWSNAAYNGPAACRSANRIGEIYGEGMGRPTNYYGFRLSATLP